jgi:hypothetical protein
MQAFDISQSASRSFNLGVLPTAGDEDDLLGLGQVLCPPPERLIKRPFRKTVE